MNIQKAFLIFGLSILSLNAQANETNTSYVYQNQRGSIMQLKWQKIHKNTGSLIGTFKTAVGNCKKDVDVPLPLIGYFNGNAISVTVNFPHCKQVVAMTGNVSDDFERIHTIWLDANQSNDPRGKDWNSNIIGSDAFQRNSTISKNSN